MSLPTIPRRSFLKSVLAAGAAPMFLPGRIWSAETKPNDRLGLGFIGIGKQCRGHLSGFIAKPETQAIAVCDVDTTRREDGKKRVEEQYAKQTGAAYKGCATHRDFRELLARPDIDAVVIVTPDHWHAPIALAAAAAGKHIYSEKPLTNTVHEAAALIEGIRKHDRVFQTGSQQRSSREFRVACELVRNGRIGKISRVETGFGPPGKPCDLPGQTPEPGLDWDMWLGPAPMRPYNEVLSPRGLHDHFPQWRAYWEYGGGMVTDWGAHHVDIAQWGLGADDSGPLEVIAPANAQAASEGGKLRYANGVELTHISKNGVTFFGSEGTVYVNRGQFALKLGEKEIANFRGKETPGATPLTQQLDVIEKEYLSDASVRLYKSDDHKADWLGAIRAHKRPIADVEIGARTVISCHLLNMAYRYGKSFQWNPKALTFAAGSGDPKWLTREYRGPWRV
jgi:predicted dehydrogenase